MIRDVKATITEKPPRERPAEITTRSMLDGLHPSVRPGFLATAAEFGVGADRITVVSPGRVEIRLG